MAYEQSNKGNEKIGGSSVQGKSKEARKGYEVSKSQQSPKSHIATCQILEHINITMDDVDSSAAELARISGWHIRWQGGAIDDGRSIHIGTDDFYLALYSGADRQKLKTDKKDNYNRLAAINHIGIMVDNLDEMEAHLVTLGYAPYSHQDDDPGRRFYFRNSDGIEFELVCYG